MSKPLVAFVPSRSKQTVIFFKGGAFITAVKSNATQFPTLLELQAAITAAYKAGTVSAAEIDAYDWR